MNAGVAGIDAPSSAQSNPHAAAAALSPSPRASLLPDVGSSAAYHTGKRLSSTLTPRAELEAKLNWLQQFSHVQKSPGVVLTSGGAPPFSAASASRYLPKPQYYTSANFFYCV